MKLDRHLQKLSLIIVAFGLAACAAPPLVAPAARLQDSQSLGLGATQSATPIPGSQWWREFGDAQLNQLVEQALTGNPPLKMAQARLLRAKALADASDAASAPQLNAGIDATRQKFTATGLYPPPLAGGVYETGTAQLTGSWELDFFGKNRAALDAALGQVRANQADMEAARTLLASNVARSYFQLARLNDLLAVARRQLAQREQSLKLVQDRVNAGLDTSLELQQSEGSLPDARLQIETLQEQLMLTRHAIGAMLGQTPQQLVLDLPTLPTLKSAAAATQVPADLLGRRADITAARWRVEAAAQDLGVARTQFYPNINLVAFAGFSSIGLDRLLRADSAQWGAGPALHLPLFDAGRLRANLRARAADLDAAIESYNATVLDAVRDVADQLASAQSVARQQTEQRAAQASAEAAYDIARQRYAAGLGNFLNVLAAETAVLNQRRQAVDLTARALENQVALMRALGGAYRSDFPS
jgi:NodT family efflux transporter outer membrane factor (OMF) lipoprotein